MKTPGLKFVPSPTPIRYSKVFSATANESGRMQYHEIIPGGIRKRISRAEFISAFNNSKIIALRPNQVADNSSTFQLEFFI